MRTRPGDSGHVALVLGPARAACEGCCRRYEDCRKCREKNEKSQRYPMWQGTQSSFREMLKVRYLPDARSADTRIGPSIRRLVRCVSAIASQQPRKDWIADQEGKSLRNRLSAAASRTAQPHERQNAHDRRGCGHLAEPHDLLAMEKVVGSSPIIAATKPPETELVARPGVRFGRPWMSGLTLDLDDLRVERERQVQAFALEPFAELNEIVVAQAVCLLDVRHHDTLCVELLDDVERLGERRFFP